MTEAEETDLQDLLVKTIGAGALGIVAAEIVRSAFQLILKPRLLTGSDFWIGYHDFIHSAISAFILIVCSYEKALLLWTGMSGAFYLLTFILCILFSRIFSSAGPSPCFPLIKYWEKIKQSAVVLENNNPPREMTINATTFLQMLLTYIQYAVPFVLGELLGLFTAIRWMKIYWDGWLTESHLNHLPMLDKCIPCLNIHTLLGFVIETAVTFAFLYLFEYVDNMSHPHDGANKLIQSFLARNCIKSAIVIISMFMFIDVTGSFANPFHSLSMQRHCMNDLTTIVNVTFVYVIGPFLATIAYLYLYETNKEKTKHSV